MFRLIVMYYHCSVTKRVLCLAMALVYVVTQTGYTSSRILPDDVNQSGFNPSDINSAEIQALNAVTPVTPSDQETLQNPAVTPTQPFTSAMSDVMPTLPPADSEDQANSIIETAEISPGQGIPDKNGLWIGKGTSLTLERNKDGLVNHILFQDGKGNTYEITADNDGKATLVITDKDNNIKTYTGTLETLAKKGENGKKGDIVFSSNGLNLTVSYKGAKTIKVSVSNDDTYTLKQVNNKPKQQKSKKQVDHQKVTTVKEVDPDTGNVTSITTTIEDFNKKGKLLGATKVEKRYEYDESGYLTFSEAKTTYNDGRTETHTQKLVEDSRTFWDDGKTVKHEEWNETLVTVVPGNTNKFQYGDRKNMVKKDFDEQGNLASSLAEGFGATNPSHDPIASFDNGERNYRIETTWVKDDNGRLWEHSKVWNGSNDTNRLTLIDRSVNSVDSQGRDFGYEEIITEQFVDKEGKIITHDSIHTIVTATYYDALDRAVMTVGTQSWGQDGSSINGLDKGWENGSASFANFYSYDSQTGRLSELHTVADGTAQNYQLDKLKSPGKRGNSLMHDYTQSDIKYDDSGRVVSYKYSDKGYKQVIGRYGVPYAVRARENGTYQINKFDENGRPTEISYEFKTGGKLFTMGRGTYTDIKYDSNGLLVSSMHDYKQIDRFKGKKGSIIDVTTKDHVNEIYVYDANQRLLKEDVIEKTPKLDKHGNPVMDKKGNPVMVDVVKIKNGIRRGPGSWDKPKVATKVHEAKGGFFDSFFGQIVRYTIGNALAAIPGVGWYLSVAWTAYTYGSSIFGR